MRVFRSNTLCECDNCVLKNSQFTIIRHLQINRFYGSSVLCECKALVSKFRKLIVYVTTSHERQGNGYT